MTFAGLNAFWIRIAGFSSHVTISIFSPLNSFTMAFTLAPFIPTHAPTGSTSGSFDHTAIFVRLPASLEIDFISTIPSFTSVTSDSKRRFTSSGCVLETRIFGPFDVDLTSRIYTFILSVGLNTSPFICSLSVRSASAFPRLILTFFPMYLCTTPVTTSFSLLLYSSKITFLSSSLIFCKITFFAFCVAILPNSFDFTSTLTTSPS